MCAKGEREMSWCCNGPVVYKHIVTNQPLSSLLLDAGFDFLEGSSLNMPFGDKPCIVLLDAYYFLEFLHLPIIDRVISSHFLHPT